jgi:hypothetical protein
MNTATDTVKKAEEILKQHGVCMPTKAIAKYQNCLSAQIFTINQINLMNRLFGKIDGLIYVHHSAIFKTEDESEKFVAMLSAKNFWVDAAKKTSSHEYFVSFHHRASGFSEFVICSRVTTVVSLIEDLNGTYCNWEIEIDPSTKKVITSSTKHDKPLIYGLWHSYEEPAWDYSEVVAELYRPEPDYSYVTDDRTGIHYSLLESMDVKFIMHRLRAGEGRISVVRLHHFEDKHLKQLKEILSRGMYTEQMSKVCFSEIALSQFRMGRKKVATELGVHALTKGEDLVGMAQKNDDEQESEVPFAMLCEKEKMRRELDAQLPNRQLNQKTQPKI